MVGIVAGRALHPECHLAIRSRQEGVPLTATPSPEGAKHAADAVRQLLGEWVTLNVTSNGVLLGRASRDDISRARDAAVRYDRSIRDDRGVVTRAAPSERDGGAAAVVSVRALRDATTETAGAKAAAAGALLRVADRPGCPFTAPEGCVVPYGALEAIARHANAEEALRRHAENADDAARVGDAPRLRAACDAAKALIESLPFPTEIAATIAASFVDVVARRRAAVGGGGGASDVDVAAASTLVARASSNVDDLAGTAGRGVYDVVVGVPASSPDAVARAVLKVMASAYSETAVINRLACGLDSADARVAAIVSETAPAATAFELDTGGVASPTLHADVVVGFGHSHARVGAGARGSPWRLRVDKRDGSVETCAFASLSTSLTLRALDENCGGGARLRREAADYSKQPLSLDADARVDAGRKLAAVGVALEHEFDGAAQIVEGCVDGDGVVWAVQSRNAPRE